jgi:hypothetical protein
MAKEIAARPDNFADAEAFRNYHAKARFRATVTTWASTVVASTILAPTFGAPSGRQLIVRNKIFAIPAIIGTWCVSYTAWNRIVGWNHK